jgi:glycopeptide antibiotics resistance protein
LFKFPFHVSALPDAQASLNLLPFAGSSPGHAREMFYNFAIFFPFGLLLSVSSKRATFWQKLAFVGTFSLAVEAIQFMFAIGVMDITDVTTNTSGGLLGLLLYDVSSRYVHHEKLDRFVSVAGAALLVLAVLPLGLIFSRSVRRQPLPRPAGMHRRHR